MADLGDMVCCLRPTDCVAVAPEERADCGPCVWSSGMISSNQELCDLVDGKALATEYRYRKPLDLDDPYAPTLCLDDSIDPPANANGAVAVPCDCSRVCESSLRVPKFMASKCWEASDMYRACTTIMSSLEDYIMDFAANEFWIRYWERMTLAMLAGITADNLANNDGDMVVNIVDNPLPTMDGTGTTTLFNQCGHVEALASLGCSFSLLEGILMHPRVWFNLVKAEGDNCCTQRYASEVIARSPMMQQRGVNTYTYQGFNVYLCDNPLLVDDSGPNPIFKTYYFGRGLFHFCEGDLMKRGIMPFAHDREECDNGGFGSSTWHARKSWAMHPMGFSNDWGKATCDVALPNDYASMSLTDAANPVFWTREMDRMHIPLTIVCSEG